jgi:site-specific DNA-methyltransferase (adenine-specific)
VAANVLAWGTGGINVDGCRVGSDGGTKAVNFGEVSGGMYGGGVGKPKNDIEVLNAGRWPAGLIHDGSDEVLRGFPQTGKSNGRNSVGRVHQAFTGAARQSMRDDVHEGYGDSGSAARFFYCAKASKRDRDEGLEGFDKSLRNREDYRREINTSSGKLRGDMPRANIHPTVKPTDLMRYLCRLVTPPGGVVLDPFMGSGSTGKAALLEGFRFIGCEMSPEYFEIAKARIKAAKPETL